MEGIIEFARKLLEDSVINRDSGVLFNALTDEFKAKQSISEISRRLAKMEEEHGSFTRIGSASTPIPNPSETEFWILDISMFVNSVEWFARLSINSECKLNDFSFFRKPFYIAPTYFNPHKVTTADLSTCPIVRFVQPQRRKTAKLPIAVFIHAAVHLDYDGHFGLRYPFRDLDFLAQHKVGLVRSSYENYGVPDAVVSLAQTSIGLAVKIPCNGGLFLIIHSFAALFLPGILAIQRSAILGIVLINPAWEAIPGSGLENMNPEKAQTGVPMLIIGSENDQVLIRDHFEIWTNAIPNAERVWLEKTDHFLMNADEIPDESRYVATEGHVDEEAMRKIFKWIRAHWSDS
jgi:hypothetical protein